MNNTHRQTGASIWVILPWLIALALATALVLLVAKHNATPLTTQSQAPKAEQIAPNTQSSEQVWQPTLATPKAHNNPDTAPTVDSYHDAVTQASLSVVNIYTTQRVQNPYMGDPVLEQFFEYYGQGQEIDRGASSLGSGVIVSKDGYIVTNAHVIEQADEITVALNDGRKARATIVGADVESDLAVIKVEMDNLVPLAFRREPIRVGDVALAIGNPFGVGQTVTQGIISATGRSGLGLTTFEDFIQTDAAINPGNSGGALVDANGALVGINTVIYSRSGGSMGIGFAIPTTIVEQVMNGLISTGRVSRGWLGVEIAPVRENPTNLTTHEGVVIANVMTDSPAGKAGLQAGDVVLSLDGKTIDNANTLIGIVSAKAPDSTLDAVVKRGDDEHELTITVGERPSRGNNRQNSQQGSRSLSSEERAYLNELFNQLNRMHGR
ncbi:MULTISPECIES: S1C family serine protease [Moraxella]|uniref:Serine protease n=1 Tax=Moraxella lacunata TaxID=477 RepID=A0A1B8Q6W5_MORLA|nr:MULTISPECIES: trypsin-like peptidase domain-containing protein [Moraxella]MBE9579663.1 trypsin-like peptidase domain-containing protein [Moraxella sp. K1664]MBE9589321.1 trypsin-like peptidase domain-containing protein [Moraxella sp. K1630]MBE9591413.1 trypsin-like peptidase domain-containing protein [Moraxella sp. K127]MBE9597590.1 trypsin-like peptidase domain-containing protein [Moraxella sp. K2450]MDH9219934.1 trypsin-like peptidase domain-containing protein [Moraxella lacunata]